MDICEGFLDEGVHHETLRESVDCMSCYGGRTDL